MRSEVMVAEVDETGLRLKDGSAIPAATVVWAAGVRAAHLVDGLGLRLGSHERIKVTPTCQVDGHPEVFAVADIGPVKLSGLPGFLAWLVVHIARIAGMRTRWLVLTN